MLKKIIPLIISTNLLTACATNQLGRSQLILLSDSQIDQMGLQNFEQIKKDKPISHNSQANQLVNCIANAITQQVGGHWEVVVFDDKSLNAFALPGKKIGVHTGLIKLVDNQDQLASVIGHEVAHVLAKHSNERVSQNAAVQQGISLTQAVTAPQSSLGQAAIGLLGTGAQYGIILPFSRLHESEADIIGLELMAKAGFNPQESIKLWQKMAQASNGKNPAEFLSTHPSHSTRIQDLKNHMPKAIKLQNTAHAHGYQPNCH